MIAPEPRPVDILKGAVTTWMEYETGDDTLAAFFLSKTKVFETPVSMCNIHLVEVKKWLKFLRYTPWRKKGLGKVAVRQRLNQHQCEQSPTGLYQSGAPRTVVRTIADVATALP